MDLLNFNGNLFTFLLSWSECGLFLPPINDINFGLDASLKMSWICLTMCALEDKFFTNVYLQRVFTLLKWLKIVSTFSKARKASPFWLKLKGDRKKVERVVSDPHKKLIRQIIVSLARPRQCSFNRFKRHIFCFLTFYYD